MGASWTPVGGLSGGSQGSPEASWGLLGPKGPSRGFPGPSWGPLGPSGGPDPPCPVKVAERTPLLLPHPGGVYPGRRGRNGPASSGSRGPCGSVTSLGEYLRTIGQPLGGPLVSLGSLLGASWEPLGALLEPSGGLLGLSWGGGLGKHLRVPHLGPLLVPSWAPLGLVLGASGAIWAPSWRIWGLYWGPLGPSCGPLEALGPIWGDLGGLVGRLRGC